MRFLSPLLVLFLLVGCANGDDPALDTTDPVDEMDMQDDADATEATEWSTMLTAQDGFEGVSASATAHAQDNEMHVSIDLSGAEAGATHPWHVHEGACGSGGGIVGDATAYPVLEVGDDGEASAETTIDVGLLQDQSYHVNVHGSPGDLGTIVACGDLNP